MGDVDQFARWRHAMAGNRIETERGNPASGFYRAITKGEPEAICIYRDDDGSLQCIRNVIGDGSWMSADQIDEVFGQVCMYPISEELFMAVTERGEPWPDEYGSKGRLTLKDQQAGVVWTPTYGRKRLGLDIDAEMVEDAAENPRAVLGDNNPPEELPLDQSLAKRIATAAERVKAWLDGIGGKPQTKDQADKVADYATRFGDLFKEADAAFATEKKPWLEGGRAVDAKWRFRTEAEELRKTYLKISDVWINAEKARLAEEQRLAHRAAQEAAKREAEATGEAAPEIAPPPPPKVTVGNIRSVGQRATTTHVVTDAKAFSAYLAAMETPPADFLEILNKIARRMGAAGVAASGIAENNRSAAA